MMRHIVFGLLLLVVAPLCDVRAGAPYDDLTIVVSSCDKYSALWSGFFQLLGKHWPTIEVKAPAVVLIANRKSFDAPHVRMVNIPDEKSWSDNMLQALASVRTKFVLFLLEDYFITHVDHGRLQDILTMMRSDPRVAYVQLYYQQMHGAAYKNHRGIYYKNKHDPYRTSLQASLWRTEDFQHLLKSGENPWQFEKIGSVRSEGLQKDFLIVMDQQPLAYLNMNHEGYLQTSQLEQALRLGVEVSTQGLKVDKDYPWKFWWKRTFKPQLRQWQQRLKQGLGLDCRKN